MDSLKGKTILIGKEPGQGRLLVAVQGNGKSAAIGAPGCVPGCVSRCKPAEGVAHAKLTVDNSGAMTLTNMKEQNVTYVNGSEIVSKRVTSTNSVELGKDRFSINLPTVIETAKKIIAVSGPAPAPQPQPARKFNISHLEGVWNAMHDKQLEIKQRQRRQALNASLPMFFTMGGGALGFVLSFIFKDQYQTEIQVISGLFVLVGLAIMSYNFISRRNDRSVEELEKIQEDFQDKYVCPNPDCGKFLGHLSYKLMKKQYSMHCPHCKCEYI